MYICCLRLKIIVYVSVLLFKIIVFICAFRKCLIFSSDACCKAHLALYLAICLTIYLIIYRKIFVAKDVSDIWRYIVRYIARYRRILGAANIRRYLAIYLTIKDKLNYLTSMPRPDNIGKPWRPGKATINKSKSQVQIFDSDNSFQLKIENPIFVPK